MFQDMTEYKFLNPFNNNNHIDIASQSSYNYSPGPDDHSLLNESNISTSESQNFVPASPGPRPDPFPGPDTGLALPPLLLNFKNTFDTFAFDIHPSQNINSFIHDNNYSVHLNDNGPMNDNNNDVGSSVPISVDKYKRVNRNEGEKKRRATLNGIIHRIQLFLQQINNNDNQLKHSHQKDNNNNDSHQTKKNIQNMNTNEILQQTLHSLKNFHREKNDYLNEINLHKNYISHLENKIQNILNNNSSVIPQFTNKLDNNIRFDDDSLIIRYKKFRFYAINNNRIIESHRLIVQDITSSFSRITGFHKSAVIGSDLREGILSMAFFLVPPLTQIQHFHHADPQIYQNNYQQNNKMPDNKFDSFYNFHVAFNKNNTSNVNNKNKNPLELADDYFIPFSNYDKSSPTLKFIHPFNKHRRLNNHTNNHSNNHKNNDNNNDNKNDIDSSIISENSLWSSNSFNPYDPIPFSLISSLPANEMRCVASSKNIRTAGTRWAGIDKGRIFPEELLNTVPKSTHTSCIPYLVRFEHAGNEFVLEAVANFVHESSIPRMASLKDDNGFATVSPHDKGLDGDKGNAIGIPLGVNNKSSLMGHACMDIRVIDMDTWNDSKLLNKSFDNIQEDGDTFVLGLHSSALRRVKI